MPPGLPLHDRHAQSVRPLAEWQALLEEILKLPQDDEGVQAAIKEAEETIAEIKAGRRSAG